MNIKLHESISYELDIIKEKHITKKINSLFCDVEGNNISEILSNKKNCKYKKEIRAILEKYGYNVYSFYSDILVDLALEDDIYSSTLTNGIYINDIKKNKDEIIMDTEHGVFSAKMLAEFAGDTVLLMRKKMGNLLGKCHKTTLEYALKEKIDSVTSFCEEGFKADIIHSYNRIGDTIFDVSHNLIMDIDEYQKLFKPKIISEISYDELTQTSEYQAYVDGMPVKPLYDIARRRAKHMSLKDIQRK